MGISFVVFAPDYDLQSGGCICLHALADKIAILGYKSFLFANIPKPGNKYNLIQTDKNIWESLDKNNTVVIYPEVVADNPLDAVHVVRWFLNKPGAFGKPTKYVPEGYQYLYSDMFEVSNKNLFMGLLKVNDPMLGIYPDITNLKKDRKGTFYTIRKGKKKLSLYPPKESWLKYDFDFTNDKNFIIQCIERFTKAEYFISYDEATFLSVIAAMCGCKSVVIPNKDLSAKEWREKNINCKFGVAYGFSEEELKYAEHTTHLIRNYLLELLSSSYQTVDNFADFWINKLNKEETSLTENKLRLYKCLAISDNQGAFSIFSDINQLSSASMDLLNNEISNLLSQNRRLDEELKKSSIDSLKLYEKLENIKSDLNKYKGYKLVRIAFFLAKRLHKLKTKLRNF